jgi:hypothetical protein
MTKNPENVDSLLINKPLSMSLNTSVNIEYIIIPILKVGFDIDAIGIGFGPLRKTITLSLRIIMANSR